MIINAKEKIRIPVSMEAGIFFADSKEFCNFTNKKETMRRVYTRLHIKDPNSIYP